MTFTSGYSQAEERCQSKLNRKITNVLSRLQADILIKAKVLGGSYGEPKVRDNH